MGTKKDFERPPARHGIRSDGDELHSHSEPIETPQARAHLQSYLRFRDLLEAAPDGIIEAERDGTIVLLNAAAEKMFGYARQELLGQLIEILVPEPLRHRHNEHRNHYGEKPITRPMGTGLELFAQRKDGSQFPVEISLSPIRSPQGARVIAIVRDITGRKQAESQINAIHEQFAAELAATNQQLEIRNREIERANRLKSDFLASMSHELRTPLHTIIGFADLLSEEIKGPLTADQKRFVRNIQQDSRHLLALINGILDLSKVESGRLELQREVFRPAEAIAEALAGLRSLAANKRIGIHESLDHKLTIIADRLRFREILYNLVSNAIKFTPETGQIRVECRDHPDGVLFTVADTGIGIPESEQRAIFDKFYQVGSTTRGIREGTGLGLAITKSLIEMHGGRIWVKSKPGEGSLFQFTLPQTGLQAPIYAAKGPPAEKVILFVSPHPENEHHIDLLTQYGYEIASAPTVDQAVSLLERMPPSAVIFNLLTLGPRSWRILQYRRGNEETMQAPVVALISKHDQQTLAALGAGAPLKKPINPNSLLALVTEHIVRSPGEPSRILVVEEDAAVRHLIGETLRTAGFLPVLASSGKKALEILVRGPISAVVTDLVMPDMSGFELILRIRQNPVFAKLPIVTLCAEDPNGHDSLVLSRQTNAVFLRALPLSEAGVSRIHEVLEELTVKAPTDL